MATKAKIKKTQPLLSVGIIFKNEIRCLERCLKSLQPLRERITMEIVMADTGSDDGSREIAAKYADVLFDFPWIDDFAAARNAVLDRCRGVWYLQIDADEWLEDTAELEAFLHTYHSEDVAALCIRNYITQTLETYSECMTLRLLRCVSGLRYAGRIHESVQTGGREAKGQFLEQTVIHHDGYVMLNDGSEAGKAKRQRNVALLRDLIAREPRNLLALSELLDAAGEEPDYADLLRRAVKLVEQGAAGWQRMGPPILRTAVISAYNLALPEAQAWAMLAERLFPNSYFIRLDVNCALAYNAWPADPEICVRYGEAYLDALAKFFDDEARRFEMMNGVIDTARQAKEQVLRIRLCAAYTALKQPERGLAVISGYPFRTPDDRSLEILLSTLDTLQRDTMLDTAPVLTALWSSVLSDRVRREKFLSIGTRSFQRKPEERKGVRPPWTLFLPLAGNFVLGDAAAILSLDDPKTLTAILTGETELNLLPTSALLHALEHGAAFPPPERPMYTEGLDALASRLAAADPERLLALALDSTGGDLAADRQRLLWAKSLVLAAVRAFNWKTGDNGLALARAVAAVEREYLPRCYTVEVLGDGYALPMMHRIGLYCVRAFDALDAGDAAGYVRALREGVESCPEMKPMTEFLLGQIERLTAPPELLALAEQVKALLAKYPPDDPAVAKLKNSPAYQKVAYLIEG